MRFLSFPPRFLFMLFTLSIFSLSSCRQIPQPLARFISRISGYSMPSPVQDYTIFAQLTPNDSGLRDALTQASESLNQGSYSKAYTGRFIRTLTLDAQRSLSYEYLSRQHAKILFFVTDTPSEILSLSLRYPQQKFAIPLNLLSAQLDAANILPPNLRTSSVRMEEGAFLAGIVAGIMTRNNKVGMLTDFSSPQAAAIAMGYAQGVRAINPKGQIVAVRTNSLLHNETTNLITVDQVDIIFAMSRNFNSDIIDAAYYFDRQALIINSWSRAEIKWAPIVVTSLIVHLDEILVRFLQYADDASAFADLPHEQNLGISDGVISFAWDEQARTPFDEANPDLAELSQKARQAELEWKQRILSHRYVVYDMEEGGIPEDWERSYTYRDIHNPF